MQAKLRTALGILILVITISSAFSIGILLPIHSKNIIEEIELNLGQYSRITSSDVIPNDGTGNYSDWMYVGAKNNQSEVYDQAVFEFFNVSDREGYLDYGTQVAYYFVQGELIFDIVLNRTVLEYNEDENYIVFANRKQYIFNPEDSTLTGDEVVLNFNYMWPYYLKHFGNGTEYGFQAYIATYLLQQELININQTLSLSFNDLATAVLNRTYAEEQNLLNIGIYLPHNWLSVRPAYGDLNFDPAASYKILYDAQYNGHDYSVLTGETGSAKFFLDLVKGLDYTEPDDLTVDVVQLLANIYGIDTQQKREMAQSFAAYLNYLLGRPSLDWLYANKISYVCKRTAMEWILGVEDPLLGNKKFPLITNQTLSSSSIDWDTDTYYAERIGTGDPTTVGEIFAIANVPYFENSKSRDLFFDEKTNLAYVIEGGTDVKIVNTTSPLFLAVGQYGDYDGKIEGITEFDGFLFAVEGTNGLEVLNATNPEKIEEIDQWTNVGKSDMRDIDYSTSTIGLPYKFVVIANGQYGLALARLSDLEPGIGTSYSFDTTGDAIAVDVAFSRAYVALGTDGIDIVDVADPNDPELINHYDSANFTQLKNVIDVYAEGGYLYVLDAVEGLLIFGDSAGVLTFEGQYAYDSTESYYNNIDVDGTKAYLTQGEYGLTVLDITDRTAPVEEYRYNGTSHKGTAYGVYVNGNDIYLSDYEQGLVHLELTSGTFNVKAKDELHTYIENWYQSSKIQFDDWTLIGTDIKFNQTYDSHRLYPHVEKGLRQQWVEYFYRPFVYSSLTDTALYFDQTVLVYTAQSALPYRQMDKQALYWMTDANFINTSFIHAGQWNMMYDSDFTPNDFELTHSFPGQPRDPFHMHTMRVEPITGSVVERRDRVQYNTRAQQFIEVYSFLNTTKYGSNPNDLLDIHKYRTWHITNPGLTGNMGTLFWQEDVHVATVNFYNKIMGEFLDKIAGADASRTLGAFASLFILAIGFVITSVVLYRTSPEFKSKKK
ncbi:MAG: LVIVD repeat-containing protein [Candidatus Heimdallarchaeaceae archaeon]